MNFFGSKLIVSCSIGDTCLHDFYIMNLPLTIQNSDGFSQRFNFRKSFATLKYYTFFYSCLACLGRFGQHEYLANDKRGQTNCGWQMLQCRERIGETQWGEMFVCPPLIHKNDMYFVAKIVLTNCEKKLF